MGALLKDPVALILLSLLLLFLLFIGILSFVRFRRDLQAVRMEISRAHTPAERRYWRRELHCLRLTLLPFVDEDRARRLYAFFHPRG